MSFALKFEPKTDEQIYGLLPDGEYDGYVSQAVHHISASSKKESIKITVTVYDKEGMPKLLDTYLTHSYDRIIKHFCKSAGLMDAYNKGEITPEMCDQKKVRVKVGNEQKDPYPAKNAIKDFLVAGDTKQETKAADNDAPFFDDDIPF